MSMGMRKKVFSMADLQVYVPFTWMCVRVHWHVNATGNGERLRQANIQPAMLHGPGQHLSRGDGLFSCPLTGLDFVDEVH